MGASPAKIASIYTMRPKVLGICIDIFGIQWCHMIFDQWEFELQIIYRKKKQSLEKSYMKKGWLVSCSPIQTTNMNLEFWQRNFVYFLLSKYLQDKSFE